MDKKAFNKKETILKVLKYVSLLILTLQNTATVLVGKYATNYNGAKPFISTTVVIIAECIKFVTCLVIILAQKRNFVKFGQFIYSETIVQYIKTLKISVPSLLYVVQNNLLLVALSNLEAAIFQVSYQLKILTTALMSVFLLKRKLSLYQWIALVILFGGVVMVNFKPSKSNKIEDPENPSTQNNKNMWIGLGSVIACCLSSAFAGVYFEKLLKQDNTDLFVSNLQLSGTGIIFSLINAFIIDGKKIVHEGFFVGYTPAVISYIFLQAFGGLVVAVVVKYADNILKGFATSVAIILSAILSYFLFSFHFTYLFISGGSLVICSVLLYSLCPIPPPVKQI